MHPQSVDSLSGLSVDSPLFRQRAPRIELSDDPDTATQQTVQEMCRQINQAAGDPLVQSIARRAVRMFAGGPQSFGYPDACWLWAKHNLRFKHHGSMFEAWSSDLGDPSTKLQLLIAPDVLVRMSSMEGDCAIYTMMICAMLEVLGVQWEIVTAAVDARQPEIFGHVWARAVLSGGTESLDASHGKYPGWQVPAYDLHRLWIFNSNGQKISEQGARFTGLHAYRAGRGRGFGRIGFGDAENPDTNVYDSSGDIVDPNAGTTYGDVSGGSAPLDLFYQDGGVTIPQGGSAWVTSSGQTYSGSAYSAPSQSSSQWASFAATMGKAGMTLAEINAIQPGTVVGSNGQILRQSTGYAVPGTTLTSTLGSMSSTSLLMMAGLAIVAVLFMSGRK